MSTSYRSTPTQGKGQSVLETSLLHLTTVQKGILWACALERKKFQAPLLHEESERLPRELMG